jgi:hypothetical protein
MAANAFEEIADKGRSVISLIDAGIDLAAAADSRSAEAKDILQKATGQTKGIESRDVQLLQRIIAKEGEGKMALAALLWDDGSRSEAESVLGDACLRMDQLQADAAARKNDKLPDEPVRLKYSLDDDLSPLQYSCSRFKNANFLSNELGWPESLQSKVGKLQTLR